MGFRTGLATGIGADEIGADTGGDAVTWTVDATSGIAVPANTTEWASFIAAKGLSVAVPDALWLLQEASGDAADASGNGFVLAASGTGLAYQQAVTGWSRKAITFTDGGTGALKSTSASLPNISTTSQLSLVIASIVSVGGTRNFLTHGTTTRSGLNVTSIPRLRAASGSNTTDGTNDPTGAVRPFVLRTNRATSATVAYSDSERITPTFNSGVTGQAVCIGDNTAATASVAVLYAAEWHVTKAEMSDANLKSLLQAMGFVITWS